MIGFYTKFKTEEANRDTLVELLTEAATSVETLKECPIYIVNKDHGDPLVTWVTEIWTTKEAHTASLQTDSAKDFISKAMPLLTAKPEQIELLPIAGKGL